MANKNKILALHITNESGDDLGVWIPEIKPDSLQLGDWLRNKFPDDWDAEGPGYAGTCLHIEWITIHVVDMK